VEPVCPDTRRQRRSSFYHGPYQFNILAREFFESDADWELRGSLHGLGSLISSYTDKRPAR
jgi:hypothetical protein